MNSIIQFVKTSIKGGVFVFLPIFFALYVLKKIIVVLTKVAKPFLKWLEVDSVLGEIGVSILVIFLMIFMFFLGGVFMKFRFFKAFNDKIESIIIALFPQYDTVKGKVDAQIHSIAEDPKDFISKKINK